MHGGGEQGWPFYLSPLWLDDLFPRCINQIRPRRLTEPLAWPVTVSGLGETRGPAPLGLKEEVEVS